MNARTAARLPMYRVVWCANRDEIGNASTERGALSVCANRIAGRTSRERFTATLTTSLQFGLAWHCGLQVRSRP